jgi:aquaporin Z
MDLARRCASEFVGTFALVFVGTGAIAVDATTGGVTPVGVALCFGLVVMAMVYALGDISGAHLNPAVSLGFWCSGQLPPREGAAYALCQCGGAVAASVLVALLLPAAGTLGATQRAVPLPAGLAIEVVISFLLMFVIVNIAARPEVAPVAGLAIGGTVALCALFAGPLTGASMNPARSIGPALVSGELADLWVFVLAPATGAALAVLCCRCTRSATCCPDPRG